MRDEALLFMRGHCLCDSSCGEMGRKISLFMHQSCSCKCSSRNKGKRFPIPAPILPSESRVYDLGGEILLIMYKFHSCVSKRVELGREIMLFE